MIFNKHKGFSLIEVMIVIGVVSLVLAVAAPILTKRMKNTHDSGCVGGTTLVKKLFIKDGTFTVPDNIVGDVTVTMVGGGGEGGYADELNLIKDTVLKSDSSPYELSQDSNLDEYNLYRNVSFHAVSAGENANCSINKAGNSGKYYYAYDISFKRNEKISFIYNPTARTWSGYILNRNASQPTSSDRNILMSFDEVPGAIGQGGSPALIQGGVPKGMVNFIPNRLSDIDRIAIWPGIGGSCLWDSGTESYKGNTKINGYSLYPSSAAYRLSYRAFHLGAGGGAGAYAQFKLNLNKNAQCSVVIGQGGRYNLLNLDETKANGGRTSLTCNGTEYAVGGGGGVDLWAPEQPGSGGSVFINIPASAIKFSGGSGGLPSSDGISGGKGGNVMNGENSIFSEGAAGGCDGALKTSECTNPHGQDGISPISDLRRAGSGGGGSSCNESSCGIGGRGADGIVILEYRTKCY